MFELFLKVEEKRKQDAESGNEIARNLEGFIQRKVFLLVTNNEYIDTEFVFR